MAFFLLSLILSRIFLKKNEKMKHKTQGFVVGVQNLSHGPLRASRRSPAYVPCRDHKSRSQGVKGVPSLARSYAPQLGQGKRTWLAFYSE